MQIDPTSRRAFGDTQMSLVLRRYTHLSTWMDAGYSERSADTCDVAH